MDVNREVVKTLRKDLQAVLDDFIKTYPSVEKIDIGSATYTTSGQVNFKLTMLMKGGKTIDEDRYQCHMDRLGLYPLGHTIRIKNLQFTSYGMSKAGKVLAKGSNGKDYYVNSDLFRDPEKKSETDDLKELLTRKAKIT